MKQIIKGKKYNTETAKKIGEYWNGKARNDFACYDEELYIKKTGEYFLYGIGGPASKYSTSAPSGGWEGDMRITPLTEEEAKKWAEQHLGVEEYENIFGEVEE